MNLECTPHCRVSFCGFEPFPFCFAKKKIVITKGAIILASSFVPIPFSFDLLRCPAGYKVGTLLAEGEGPSLCRPAVPSLVRLTLLIAVWEVTDPTAGIVGQRPNRMGLRFPIHTGDRHMCPPLAYGFVSGWNLLTFFEVYDWCDKFGV